MTSPAEGIRLPWNEPQRVRLPRHLYAHIPLCRSKCSYCDFYSVADDSSVSHDDLVAATVRALRSWLVGDVEPPPLDTLYIGGGTPTVLGAGLSDLVRQLVAVMPLAPGAEVTVEANPDSLTERLCHELVGSGVTRISVGVQSLDDTALQRIGRRHDSETALTALRVARSVGLDVSADLICGIRGVSPASWRASLDGVMDAGAQHVSAYPLTVESGTPMAVSIAEGRMQAPDDDATVDAMEAAAEVLAAAGMERYEVANYALPGHESRHNLAYWTGRPYLGIGGGAHGMFDGRQARACDLAPADDLTVARVRYAYSAHPFPVESESPLQLVEFFTSEEAAREDAMLGMRMTAGIDDALAERAGAREALESLVTDGLVAHEGDRWRPTTRGWLFGNEMFGRIWNAGE